MRKGVMIIELIILVVLIVIIVLASTPRLIRTCGNNNILSTKLTCGNFIDDVEAYRIKNGQLPKNVSELTGYCDQGLIDSMYDQNPDDTLIATDGTNIQCSFKSHRYVFLNKTNYAPDGSVDLLVRGVMALPTRWDKGGDTAFYHTNESSKTYQRKECWELAINSPTTPALAVGSPTFFKPAGPTSQVTALVYEADINFDYFRKCK